MDLVVGGNVDALRYWHLVDKKMLMPWTREKASASIGAIG